jgi:hypothetical protein
MNFVPKMRKIEEMDSRLFQENKMNIKKDFLQKLKSNI